MDASSGTVVALKNLQQQTYDLLVRRIFALEPGFQPGSRLDIPALAAELGVSPTPIKESLRLLQAHGLIEMSPRRGTYVASLSREQFDEYVDVLRELELAALRLAAGKLGPEALEQLHSLIDVAQRATRRGQEVEAYRLNQAFHEAIVALAGNRELANLYSSPRGYLLTVVYRTRDPEMERLLLDQHRAIADALSNGQIDRARDTIAEHWDACRALGHAAIDTLNDPGRLR